MRVHNASTDMKVGLLARISCYPESFAKSIFAGGNNVTVWRCFVSGNRNVMIYITKSNAAEISRNRCMSVVSKHQTGRLMNSGWCTVSLRGRIREMTFTLLNSFRRFFTYANLYLGFCLTKWLMWCFLKLKSKLF